MVANLFALFSSMCEQKVSAYMPSWALLVMTAVCEKVRKKTIELLTRIKQKLHKTMNIGTKIKTSENGTISPIDMLGLIDEIQRYTMEKRTWVPSLSKGRLLRPSIDCSPYNERWKCEWKNSKLLHSSERWKAYEMVLIMSITKEWVSSNLNSITIQRIPWRNDGHSWLFIAKHWAIVQPLLNVKRGSLGHN